jgi:hypothetical protein
MRDLRTLREGWDEVEKEERRLAELLTIEQSVKIFIMLCDSLTPLMDETEELFRGDREAYLTALQARLRRFDEWQRQDGETREPA